MLEASNRMSSAGRRVKVTTGSLEATRTEKLFVNTTGAHLRQSMTYVLFAISAIATADDGYSYRRRYEDMSQAGWEFIEGQALLREAERVGREANELVAAPWAPSGPYTAILASDFVA